MKKAVIVYLAFAALFFFLSQRAGLWLMRNTDFDTPLRSEFFGTMSALSILVAVVAYACNTREEDEQGGVAWLFPIFFTLTGMSALLCFTEFAGTRMWWAQLIFYPSLVLFIICWIVAAGRALRPYNG